jgi:hypothetical protein
MKFNIKLLAAMVIPTALVWLALGFVFWNWSPETWTEGARAAGVMLSFMLTLPAIGFFGEVS